MFFLKAGYVSMQGFDRGAAAAFIMKRLDTKEFRSLAADAKGLIEQTLDADLAYMTKADGTMGEAYYDDDDAFEFILDYVAKLRRTPEKQMDDLCAFIDQYMELAEQYMTEAGLISWD